MADGWGAAGLSSVVVKAGAEFHGLIYLPRPARIEGALMVMYSPIQLLDERTSFFDDNRFGRSYKKYVVWWVDRAREP